MGGVGAIAPPRASFLGVRSLSLVLPDFGTLPFSFFLVLIFLFSLSCFVLRCNHLRFWIIRIRAKLSKSSKNVNNCRYLALISKALSRDSLPKIYNSGENRVSV